MIGTIHLLTLNEYHNADQVYLWSTVSKALLKSKNIPQENNFASMGLWTLSVNYEHYVT